MRDGPSLSFCSDYPYVSKYYLSQDDPEQTCETMRAWSAEMGLTEWSVPEEAFLSCKFAGAVGSDRIDVLVTPGHRQSHWSCCW